MQRNREFFEQQQGILGKEQGIFSSEQRLPEMQSSGRPSGGWNFRKRHRFGRLQGTELIQPQPTQGAATGGGRDAGLDGDLLASPTLATQPPISATTAWGVGCRSRCGRDERSCNPANPSRRYRSTQTVRRQMPAASAKPSGGCPLSTCRTIRSRPRGVSRAFLCMFIRFSLGI